MNLAARHPRSGRFRTAAVLLVAAVGCAVVVAVTGWRGQEGTARPVAQEPPGSTSGAGAGSTGGPTSRSAGSPGSTVGSPESPGSPGSTVGSPYSVMQMNLCLSGLAGCYDPATYPAVVEEAVARIRDAHPDAVTFNEACERDATRIAAATGYHLRFSRVVYAGALLPCVDPGGRGLFGDAVLTKAAIDDVENRDFRTQSGLERRRWLCVTTRLDVDVCTTHLSTRLNATERATNDGQCAELGALLARRSAMRAVVFGGDVNRRGSCAPDGVWTRTDGSADRAAGIQHVYGGAARLRSPSGEVVPARHTDHDVLLVRARLVAR